MTADQYARERIALAEFKKMLPMLNTYARAVSKRTLKVKVGTFNHTDGEDIFLRPPMELADRSKHDRVYCGQRADNEQLICDACHAREDVLGGLHHEIAHLIHGTYTEYPNSMVQAVLGNEVERCLGSQAKRNFNKAMAKPEAYPWVGAWSYQVSPELPAWMLCLEDVRVNLKSFDSMGGLRTMQFARYSRTLIIGMEQEDGSYYRHSMSDADVQVNMAVLFASQGHDLRGWLADDVVDTLEDETIARLIEESRELQTPIQSAGLALKFIHRLRELGYYGAPEEEKDEEPVFDDGPGEDQKEEQESDDSGDSGDTGGSGGSDDSGSDSSDVGEDGEAEGGGGAEDGEAGDAPAGDHEAEGSGDQAEDSVNDGASEDAPGYPSGDDDASGSDEDQGDGSGDGSDSAGGGGEGESSGVGDRAGAEGAEPGPDAGGSSEVGDSDGDAAGDGDEAEADGEHVRPESNGAYEPSDQGSDSAADAEADEADPEADRDSDSSGAGGDEPGDDEGDAVRGASDDGADAGSGDVGGDSDGTEGEDDDAEAGDLDSGGSQDGDPRDEQSDDSGDQPGAGDVDQDGPEAEPQDQGGDGTGASDSGDEPVDHDADPEAGQEGKSEGQAPMAADEGDEQFDDGAAGAGDDAGLDGTGDIEGAPLPETDTASGERSGDSAGAGRGAERTLAPRPTSPLEERMDNLMHALAALIGHSMLECEDGHLPSQVANDDEVESDPWGDRVSHKPMDELTKVIACLAYLDNISPNLDAPRVELERDMPKSSAPALPVPGVVNKATTRARLIFAANKRVERQRNMKSGRIKGSMLGRRVPVQDVRLFERKQQPDKKDWETLIMLDRSFSTCGDVNRQIKSTAMGIGEVHARVGIPFSIWASSTADIGYDSYSPYWAEVKSVKSPWDKEAHKRLGGVRPVSGNLDGHTMQFCRKQLERSRATNKLLLYFTDGAMPASNYEEELELLQSEIKLMGKLGFAVVGVGMGTDSPRDHGLDTVEVNGPQDIGLVIDHLAKVLK